MEKDLRDSVFDEVYASAEKDKSIIFLSADADAFSIQKFRKDFPEQYINVGVSEQNMVGIAAGLALSGKKVFMCAIIPFITLRCYEQIKVNICSMNIPVTILGIGAGLSFGFDGATHHAVCDVAVMRTLPEMSIYNPSDPSSSVFSVQKSLQSMAPSYIRVDKGTFKSFGDTSECDMRIIRHGGSSCIVSTGVLSHTAKKVANRFKEWYDFDIEVIDICSIKPFNCEKFYRIVSGSKYIFVLEDNIATGGLFDLICANNNRIENSIKRCHQFSIPDCQTFVYGDRNYLYRYYGIDDESLMTNIYKTLKQYGEL